MEILQVKEIKKTYTTRFGGNQVQALKGVSFSVQEGEYVAIMGESGSGKTTLLNILAALDKPTGGQVMLAGKRLDAIEEKELAAFRRDNLGFVFQEFNLLDTFSIEDNILLPLVLAGRSVAEMKSAMEPLVRSLGIDNILKKFPYEVSGGQKQRAAVARAMITNPKLLLADEPTGALDSASSADLLQMFEKVNRQGQTILMENYRRFVDPRYSVRQVLVEHFHFNDDSYRLMLKGFFERCVEQNAVPIVNYNDAVNMDEIRKFEIQSIREKRSKVVECVDNDETAAQIALLLNAETLLILTSVDGIYRDPKDSSTIIRKITAQTPGQLIAEIEQCEQNCSGSSRKGANGARAKLEYVKDAACAGTRVLIANAKYPVERILRGEAPSTMIGLNL